jgi:hypothetical protein
LEPKLLSRCPPLSFTCLPPASGTIHVNASYHQKPDVHMLSILEEEGFRSVTPILETADFDWWLLMKYIPQLSQCIKNSEWSTDEVAPIFNHFLVQQLDSGQPRSTASWRNPPAIQTMTVRPQTGANYRAQGHRVWSGKDRMKGVHAKCCCPNRRRGRAKLGWVPAYPVHVSLDLPSVRFITRACRIMPLGSYGTGFRECRPVMGIWHL